MTLSRDHADPVIMDFPMTDDEDAIRKKLESQADIIAPFAREGTAVFGMIGDPSFYSTFSRLCQIMSGEVSGNRIPGGAGDKLHHRVRLPSGRAVYQRGFHRLGRTRSGEHGAAEGQASSGKGATSFGNRGYNQFFLAERIYMPGERIYGEADMPENSDYFSIMFARR